MQVHSLVMKLALPSSLLWGWSWRINSTSHCVLDQHVINSGVRRLLQSKVRNMNAKPTTHQQLLLQQQRNSLWCSIESWREIQCVYLPFTSQYHEPTTQADDDTNALSSKPEKLLLHLPSSLLASTPFSISGPIISAPPILTNVRFYQLS